MQAIQFMQFMHIAETLKNTTRHSWTSSGRHESVAEHTWRMALMALILQKDFPDIDPMHLLKMALVHDLGEIATGDIPAFYKTAADTEIEAGSLPQVLAPLPAELQQEITDLIAEYDAAETECAKLCKALDKLEVIIQHNEADLSTWLPLEKEMNLTHGENYANLFPLLKEARAIAKLETIEKLQNE